MKKDSMRAGLWSCKIATSASLIEGNVVKLRARPPLEGAVSEADWGSSEMLEPG